MAYSRVGKPDDPRWQKKSLKIFEKDNWTCCACGSTDKPLYAYHIVHGKGLDA